MRVSFVTDESDPITTVIDPLARAGFDISVINGESVPEHAIRLFTISEKDLSEVPGRHVRVGATRLEHIPDWVGEHPLRVGVRPSSIKKLSEAKVSRTSSRSGRGTLVEALEDVKRQYGQWTPDSSSPVPWNLGGRELSEEADAAIDNWLSGINKITSPELFEVHVFTKKGPRFGTSNILLPNRGFSAGAAKIKDGTLSINLAATMKAFALALQPLVAALREGQLKDHPVWGKLLPGQNGPVYSNTPSPGHCIRPDVILTADGPKVCELDFVPSGRGWALSNLVEPERRAAFLEAFASWYMGMGFTRVAYATASTTVCFEETQLFAEVIAAHGIDMRAVNIDTTMVGEDELIDRLFYRSEMARTQNLADRTVITSEPWLDSKMVFAIVHDDSMTDWLTKVVGEEGLTLLRRMMIKTIAIETVDDSTFWTSKVLGRSRSGRPMRYDWIIKNTDVESNQCWGCRGVVFGARFSQDAIEDAILGGKNPRNKVLGAHPVLQPFVQSLDFGPAWNASVAGQITSVDPATLGKGQDPVTSRKAMRQVFGRVGVYLLLNNVTGEVTVPPSGVLTMRQDMQAHGARDAIMAAFDLV